VSSSGSTSPAIIPRNDEARPSASSTFRPLTASVIIEAELWEIEHPAPWKVAAVTMPSSTVTATSISSPHSGLFRLHVAVAPGSSRLFRGLL